MKILRPIFTFIKLFIAFLIIIIFNIDLDPKSYEEDY